jgi:hypothetical protein
VHLDFSRIRAIRDRHQFSSTWQETDGPAITAPQRKGSPKAQEQFKAMAKAMTS